MRVSRWYMSGTKDFVDSCFSVEHKSETGINLFDHGLILALFEFVIFLLQGLIPNAPHAQRLRIGLQQWVQERSHF